MIIFLVTYRATDSQTFRRDEIIDLLDNIKDYMELNNIDNYKIIISEQNNNDSFNKGILYNAAFLESEKKFKNFKKYIMINVDYRFNRDLKFPLDYLLSNNGFIDIYTVNPNIPILGGCCSVDPVSFLLVNGFPNNIYGWGGEDWAILRRIYERRIIYNKTILNKGLVYDESGWNVNDKDRIVGNDYDTNQINMQKARQDGIFKNGLDNCYYSIDGFGEFHNGNSIIHLLVSFDYKNFVYSHPYSKKMFMSF